MNLDRRSFIKNGCLGLAALAAGRLPHAAAQTAPDLPNIVFVLADDLGWHELGCYGNAYNETPHLDALADAGLRFTDAYAAAPVCSPYRAALMTGQAPARLGITDYIRPNSTLNLARQYVTIAERLKQAGYRTGMVGKWHLSGYESQNVPEQVRPSDQGFDEVMISEEVGIGNGDYWHPYSKTDPSIPRVLPSPEYLVDRCNHEALQFIQRNHAQPFFLYLSHYAVHTTLDGKPDLVAHFEGKPNSGSGPWATENNPHLAAQLFSIDEGVGAIRAKLAEHNIADNTIIVFMGDNGGESRVTTNGPLRAGKSTCYEGGIRVPLVIHWPARITAPATCSEPVTCTDFYPTFCQLTGLTPPADQPMDGLSLVPLFDNPAANLPRQALYWHYPLDAPHFLGGRSAGAIRKRDWKLIEFFDDNTFELYHLANDLSEQNDLKAEHPDRALELLNDLRAWRSRIPRLADTDANGAVDLREVQKVSQNWLGE